MPQTLQHTAPVFSRPEHRPDSPPLDRWNINGQLSAPEYPEFRRNRCLPVILEEPQTRVLNCGGIVLLDSGDSHALGDKGSRYPGFHRFKGTATEFNRCLGLSVLHLTAFRPLQLPSIRIGGYITAGKTASQGQSNALLVSLLSSSTRSARSDQCMFTHIFSPSPFIMYTFLTREWAV